VTTLEALDPSSVGLLDTRNGGLGTDMWAGSSRRMVERLLPHLPANGGSPALQGLQRRLLASVAQVPPGSASGPSLLGLRVERLVAMGQVSTAVELARLAPQHMQDATLSRALVDALWLAGDTSGACARARDMIRTDNANYWLKAVTFCRALDGEHAAAALAVGLLREQGEDDEPFYTLMAALAGDSAAELTNLPNPSPLHIAMMRAAKRVAPEDALANAAPGVLGAMSRMPGLPLYMRLRAAERAEAAGAITPEVLGQIYGGRVFSSDEIANAATLVEQQEVPDPGALLYQLAQVQEVPTARAEALQLAWTEGRRSGRYLTAVHVNAPALESLQPSGELSFAAADAGRALLLLGRAEAVVPWYEMVRQQALANDTDAQKAALDLWALLQLGDDRGLVPWDANFLGRWLVGQSGLDGEGVKAKAETFFTLASALGYQVPAAQWQALIDPEKQASEGMSSAFSHALSLAAAEGKVGETVLLALLAVGERGPGQTDLATIAAVVEALRMVGLDQDARMLAIEAAVAKGL
jgi:hypothetical protein